LLFVPLTLCLVACGGENDAPDVVSMFTGRLQTADAVVGLAVSASGDVDAYVCGGDTNYATHSRWFAGSFASNAASLQVEDLGLDLTLQGDKIDVTFTAPDGTVHKAQAEKAADGNHSALYEASADADCRWGVVVLDDGGAEPQVSGTWCNLVASTETFLQVTPVLPIDFSTDVLPVLVNTPDGELRFEVRRASVSRAAP